MKKTVVWTTMLIALLSLTSCGQEEKVDKNPITWPGATIESSEKVSNTIEDVTVIEKNIEETIEETTEGDVVSEEENLDNLLWEDEDKIVVNWETIPNELFNEGNTTEVETTEVWEGQVNNFNETIVDVEEDIENIKETIINVENIEYEPETDLSEIIDQLEWIE